MILYISGPMTGIEDFNRPLFREVRDWLLEADAIDQQQVTSVLSPHMLTDGVQDPNKPWDFYMRGAVKMLMEADTIVMLPGWTKSKGARREFDLAIDLDMDIWYLRALPADDTAVYEMRSIR